MNTVLVVGAGIGGIATAARLARAGYDVTVLERSDQPGGRTNILEKDGFRFDTGPTLFLMPHIFERTYAELGERMEDHLDLVRLDPTYRIHFHDGVTLDLTADMVRMRQQLDSIEPGAFQAYLRFLSEGYRHYYVSLDRFVGRNFRSIWEYFSPANLPLLVQLKALMTHYTNTSRYFRSERLRAAFSFQNVYLGVSPYEALATYSLLQYTELAEGVWFPRGGMYDIIRSLTSIAAGLGVKFHYNTPVASIDTNGQRVRGVTLATGERLQADIVVANADLPYVYNDLLPDKPSAQRMNRLKYTSSALMFYWGVRGEVDQLLPHNVFLSENRYRESFDRIFRDLTLPDQPSFYVHVPAKINPDFAPAGDSGLMILVPVGHMNESYPQDWDWLKQQARTVVLDKLERLGVRGLGERIVTETTLAPPDYHAMNLAKGSAFGLSHNFLQVGYLRPQNRHARYGNLYFAGASTHPGSGLPIVLLSSQLTAERIQEEHPAPSRVARTNGARPNSVPGNTGALDVSR
jgi:phytoene desaturase